MAKLFQSDVAHDCRASMWHCTGCKNDFCMAETPVFCPFCGEKGSERVGHSDQLDVTHSQGRLFGR
jgi:rubrerythrin